MKKKKGKEDWKLGRRVAVIYRTEGARALSSKILDFGAQAPPVDLEVGEWRGEVAHRTVT